MEFTDSIHQGLMKLIINSKSNETIILSNNNIDKKKENLLLLVGMLNYLTAIMQISEH